MLQFAYASYKILSERLYDVEASLWSCQEMKMPCQQQEMQILQTDRKPDLYRQLARDTSQQFPEITIQNLRNRLVDV